MNKQFWLAIGAILAGPATAWGDIPTDVKAKLQSAMIAHVDGVMVDGAYTYLDTTSNTIETVYPANVHPMVIPAGDDFFVCSEIRPTIPKSINPTRPSSNIIILPACKSA